MALSENADMNKLLLIAMMAVLSACGVSPRVRVEPAPASLSSIPRAGAIRPSSTNSPLGQHVVLRGDTLYSIAFRNGLDVRDLIAWNGLTMPFTIYPGQALKLKPVQPVFKPTPPATQPVVGDGRVATTSTAIVAKPLAAGGATTSAPALGAHAIIDQSQPVRVESLDASAATAPPTTLPSLRAPNPSTTPRPGSLLAAIAASPNPSTAPTNGAVSSTHAMSPPVAQAAAPAMASPPVVIDPFAPSQGREGIQWRWPTGGNVIGRFVAGDPTQQGIDIGGKLGQLVLAVADGEVVYSGNGLLGYGEMIIVQHSPDYLSAYGHNQRRLVAEGSKVKAGQVIAEMGQRGSQVMLHFEVRRRGKPVDPLAYLPPR